MTFVSRSHSQWPTWATRWASSSLALLSCKSRDNSASVFCTSSFAIVNLALLLSVSFEQLIPSAFRLQAQSFAYSPPGCTATAVFGLNAIGPPLHPSVKIRSQHQYEYGGSPESRAMANPWALSIDGQ